MTSLFTQCPHCQTSFRVSNAQLNAAHGLVRCGSCLGVFSASANEIRVKHPDGYVVEELESDIEEELDGADEPEDKETVHAGYAPHAQERSADNESTDTPFEAVSAEIGSTTPDQPIANDTIEELWHRPGEPHFTFGDLRLDELDKEFDEEHPDASHAAEHDADYIDDEPATAELDDENVEAFIEEYADEIIADAEGNDDELDEPYEENFDEAFAELEPEPEIFAPAAKPTNLPAEKQYLHARLGALSFDDALEPVSEHELQGLDDVPVTLVHKSSFRSRVVTTLLLATNLLLLLALPLPWLYTHRNELAKHPRFSFLAEPVCRYLTCASPPLAVPATLYSQQLLVRSHPKQPDALEVSFVFHNDANQPQNFPKLELAFSDINNHVLANRLFTPDEYLPPELRHLSQMPAQSTMQIHLELVDPGKTAVNYKVELYPL